MNLGKVFRSIEIIIHISVDSTLKTYSYCLENTSPEGNRDNKTIVSLSDHRIHY